MSDQDLNVLPVAGPDDPAVAAFRNVRERDLVGREGRFIAEGEVVLRSLARSRLHQIERVLIDRRRLAKLEPVLRRAPPGAPIHVADQDVLDAVAGFHLHRGVLALGRRGPERSAAELLGEAQGDCAVICLFAISNHDNMGGLFRNAAAFGARAVLLDSRCCDPLYRKAIRVSVGAALEVPFARFAPGEDALATLAGAGFEPVALSPSGETDLETFQPSGKTALLLGAEGPGLDGHLMSRARTVRIRMVEPFDSLNVATAAAVALHALATRRRGARSV